MLVVRDLDGGRVVRLLLCDDKNLVRVCQIRLVNILIVCYFANRLFDALVFVLVDFA